MDLNQKQYGGFKLIESTVIQIKKMFLLVIKKIGAFIQKFIINPTKKGLESVLKNINKLLKKTFSKTSKHINKIDNKIQSGGGMFTFLKNEVSTAIVRLKSGFLSKVIIHLKKLFNFCVKTSKKSFNYTKTGILKLLQFITGSKFGKNDKTIQKAVKKTILNKNKNKKGGSMYSGEDLLKKMSSKSKSKRIFLIEKFRENIYQKGFIREDLVLNMEDMVEGIDTAVDMYRGGPFRSRRGDTAGLIGDIAQIVATPVIKGIVRKHEDKALITTKSYPVYFINNNEKKCPLEIVYPKNNTEASKYYNMVYDDYGNYNLKKAAKFAQSTEIHYLKWLKERSRKTGVFDKGERKLKIYQISDLKSKQNIHSVGKLFISEKDYMSAPKATMVINPKYYQMRKKFIFENTDIDDDEKDINFKEIEDIFIKLNIKGNFFEKIKERKIYSEYQFIELKVNDFKEFGITNKNDLEKIKQYQIKLKKKILSDLENFNNTADKIINELHHISINYDSTNNESKELEKKLYYGWFFALSFLSFTAIFIGIFSFATSATIAGLVLLPLGFISAYGAYEFNRHNSKIQKKIDKLQESLIYNKYYKVLLTHEKKIIEDLYK
jgi:hypothetical protein